MPASKRPCSSETSQGAQRTPLFYKFASARSDNPTACARSGCGAGSCWMRGCSCTLITSQVCWPECSGSAAFLHAAQSAQRQLAIQPQIRTRWMLRSSAYAKAGTRARESNGVQRMCLAVLHARPIPSLARLSACLRQRRAGAGTWFWTRSISCSIIFRVICSASAASSSRRCSSKVCSAELVRVARSSAEQGTLCHCPTLAVATAQLQAWRINGNGWARCYQVRSPTTAQCTGWR